MTCGIYKIVNKINGKIYIGQSIEIENRWKKHLSAKDDFIIHKAIQKYGKENFEFSIIEECDSLDLDKNEIKWINFYNSLIPNGYNMVDGGSNGIGLSKGYRVIQYSLEGNYLSTYDSANQASSITGIDHWSICACCRNEYKHAGGYQWKYENSDKIILPISIRMNFSVLQLDKATNKIIAEYPSLREASNKTGIASSTICNVCNGKGKTAGGFKWKYKNNN